MPRSLLRIYADVKNEPWWEQRPNATGRLQLYPLVKLVAALRVLAYGGIFAGSPASNNDLIVLGRAL